MYLIQILLPLRDNQGTSFEVQLYEEVRVNLADHFGGVTTYMRAPATGEAAGGEAVLDPAPLLRPVPGAVRGDPSGEIPAAASLPTEDPHAARTAS